MLDGAKFETISTENGRTGRTGVYKQPKLNEHTKLKIETNTEAYHSVPIIDAIVSNRIAHLIRLCPIQLSMNT